MALALIMAAWVGGLLLGLAWRAPLAVILPSLCAAAVLALLLKLRKLPWQPAALIVVAVLGLWRAGASSIELPGLSAFNGQSVRLEGVVAQDPEPRGASIRLVVDAGVEGGGKRGRVLVWAAPPAALLESRDPPYFRYGDRLRLEGAIEAPEPFDGFDYPEYLARQGIASVMYRPQVSLVSEGWGNPLLRAAFAVRHRLADSLARALPGETAAVAQALLLDYRGDVSDGLGQAFRDTGASHILAISGQHLAILLLFAVGASAWLLGRRRGLYLLPPLVLMWAYALISGYSPSVARSAIMGSVYLAALALGRPGCALAALALACGVMAGLEPRVLLDISFQLSVTAVAGIALVGAPLAERWAEGERQFPGRRWLALAVATGLAATLATLPLIAFHFHRVSPLGVPATLALLPAVPFMLAASMATALAGLAHPWLGQVAGWAAWLPLNYMTWLVGLLGKSPGAAFSVPGFAGAFVWAYYAVCAALYTRFGRRWTAPGVASARGPEMTLPRGARARALLAVGLGSIAALVWVAALSAPDGRLHIYYLDVGQGDAALVVTPGGRQVLIDGGPDGRDVMRQLGRRMPFWDHGLDMVVASHLQDDHIAGLVDVASRLHVGAALEAPDTSSGASAGLVQRWRGALEAQGAPTVQARAGQRVPLGNGVELEALAPGDRRFDGVSATNNNGLVLRLTYGETSFLFTADIEREGEVLLMSRHPDLRSDVLKLAHHGSETSTSAEFLGAVAPRVAVVSAGRDNAFRHPRPAVVERVRDSGARLYVTADVGTVEVVSDGRELTVRTHR